MLPSPATERRTSKNVGPGPRLMSCEAERDLVLVIKSARGTYIGQRISRIASMDPSQATTRTIANATIHRIFPCP